MEGFPPYFATSSTREHQKYKGPIINSAADNTAPQIRPSKPRDQRMDPSGTQLHNELASSKVYPVYMHPIQ